MTAVLLDTHAWTWTLTDDERLAAAARKAILDADVVLISPISFFEIAQKVRLGKWPEMAPLVADLSDLVGEQGGAMASFNPAICIAAGMMAWAHRDPFDRLLAATALHHRVPLVSADTIFDGIVARLW